MATGQTLQVAKLKCEMILELSKETMTNKDTEKRDETREEATKEQGTIFTKLYLLTWGLYCQTFYGSNLRIFIISWSVYLWLAFSA
jgi:hypothetical protein